MDDLNLKFVLSGLANELKEQTKSLIELGWSLNSFSNLIDGESVDLSKNVINLQECYDRNASIIESCVLLNHSTNADDVAVDADVEEPTKSEHQINTTTFDVKEELVDKSSCHVTPETHYCRKCRGVLTEDCAKTHMWAIIKRKHPAPPTAKRRKPKRTESVKMKASYKCRRFKKRKQKKLTLAAKEPENVANIKSFDDAVSTPVYDGKSFIDADDSGNAATTTFEKDDDDSSFVNAEDSVKNFGDAATTFVANDDASFVDVEDSPAFGVVAEESTKFQLAERVVEAFMEICDAVKKLPVCVDPLAGNTKLAYMKSVIQCPICNVNVTYQNIIEHVICRHDSTKELMLLRCCPFCNETRKTISHLSSHVMWIHVSKR